MDEKKEQLKNEILQYLNDHPNAADTVTGIVGWWLLEQTAKHRIELVKDALNSLVDEGLVIARRERDSQTRYKINRRRRREIYLRLQKKS